MPKITVWKCPKCGEINESYNDHVRHLKSHVVCDRKYEEMEIIFLKNQNLIKELQKETIENMINKIFSLRVLDLINFLKWVNNKYYDFKYEYRNIYNRDIDIKKYGDMVLEVKIVRIYVIDRKITILLHMLPQDRYIEKILTYHGAKMCISQCHPNGKMVQLSPIFPFGNDRLKKDYDRKLLKHKLEAS